MKRLLPLAALAMLSLPAHAQVATESYVGLDYTYGIYQEHESRGGETVSPGLVRLLMGTDLNNAFQAEFAYFRGVTSGTTKNDNSFDAVEGFGNYIRATFPANDQLGVYARLGFTALYFDESHDYHNSVGDRDAFGYTYGLGLDYRMGGESYLNADYTVYMDEPNHHTFRFSGVSVGAKVRF